ncbi:hypothetical protein ACRAWD_20280 [Caulobacter segnis]
MSLTQIGVAVPNFWFAVLLVMVFFDRPALGLGWRFPGLGGGPGAPL